MAELGKAVQGEVVLSLDRITKRFPGVTALQDVSFDIRAGEVHMLLGENGAGKSTLVNIIIGNFPPDGESSLAYRGTPVAHQSPANAKSLGINAVLQDFSLVPTLSIAENMWLGRETTRLGFRRKSLMRQRAAEAFAALDLAMDVSRRVDTLTRAEQQVVEIVKALQGEPGVLLLDEPTAALTHDETDRLFEIVKRLRDDDWAILYITHRLEEIRRMGDRVTVLRDGRFVATHRLEDADDEQLIREMTGRTFTAFYPRAEAAPAEVRLRTDHLGILGGKVHDATITLRAGEIVGIAGLVGSGKSEVARTIFGLEEMTAGSIELYGEEVPHPTPPRMLAAGVVYFPQDRRREALALARPVRENISLEALGTASFARRWLVRRRGEKEVVNGLMEQLDIRPRDTERAVSTLSGGNQQKCVLARGLTRERKVYMFDEPTAGVDVGAKVEIYLHMKRLCEAGAAILLVSSDMAEVIHLAHRVYVMHRGQTVAELEGDALTQEAVAWASFGNTASVPA